MLNICHFRNACILCSITEPNNSHNIKLHAKNRIKRFFRISGIDATAEEINHTISFMFNSFSECEARIDLIEKIPNIRELHT